MSHNRVLIVDDEQHMRWIISRALEKEGYEVDSAADGAEALARFSALPPDVVILDIRLPDMDGLEVLAEFKREQPDVPVVMITAHGTVESAIQAMKAGCQDYITKPFDIEELKIIVKKSLDVRRLSSEVDYLRQALDATVNKVLVGKSRAIQEIRDLVAKVADTNATVLITGESGTGKEVVARLLHERSERAREPFVASNCAAIPENLLESELFGYEKGAFTGAHSRKQGKLEVAGRGTVFLDEIGDMPLSMQAKLLRVLQERTFERIGGTQPVVMQARIMAATNKNLLDEVGEGRFREDLYYRLQVIVIKMPPLRERKEDIPDLVRFFLERHDPQHRIKSFDTEAMDLLLDYSWPGNVRELENTVERAIILSDAPVITPGFLQGIIEPRGQKLVGGVITFPDEGISLEAVERELIIEALKKSGGNQTVAARLLGITRSALIYRMAKHNIIWPV